MVLWNGVGLALAVGPLPPYRDGMTTTNVPDRPSRPGAPSVLGPAVVDAYLCRLGVSHEPPSPAALARLHRAHVERVPYETFWLHLGDDIGTDPVASAQRIARTTRGGYCFHLNGAFAELLDALGYTVTRHVAGVHDAAGPSADTLSNHVALVVHALPSPDHPAGEWYVDAGLGDVLHEPLPLMAGRFRQGPMSSAIEMVADGVGDWHFVNDPHGSLGGVSIVAEPVGIEVFAERHAFNVTSPASGFRRTVTCQRRHATGADVLRGRVLTRQDGSTTTTSTVESSAGLLAVLDDVFGMRLDVPAAALGALWTRMCAAHDGWLARQAVAS